MNFQFSGWTFPKNIWVATTGCQWQIHFWHLCWSFWAHLATLCWELFLGRFLLIGRSIDSTFFGTSIEETPQNCSNTLTVVQWDFQIGSMQKKQHAFTKNLKKPAVANGDLGAIFSASKVWRCDHCWPRCNTKFNSNLRINGWSSYGKLRLCLTRFTTSLQTTPTKVLNATWVKCTTIDGRSYCTDWFGWYLNFSMEFCVSRQLLQDPVRQFCQVAIEFNGHSVDWEENILTTKISWTIANSRYIVHPETMVNQLDTKSVFSPVF